MAGMIQNMVGLGDLTEQVIANDFLLASKTAIKNYATAISEAATPEVRDTLRKQMNDAISTNEKITNYMMHKGYYQAYNPTAQISADKQASDTVMSLNQ